MHIQCVHNIRIHNNMKILKIYYKCTNEKHQLMSNYYKAR